MTTAVDEKLCECGCGEPTKPYRRTDNSRGRIKGEYARYIQGHNYRMGEPKVRQPRMTQDEILNEWEYLRGEVRWQFFHKRVHLSYSGWSKLFADAAERGDPRAVKHPDDEPVRHWRAHDTDREKAS